MSSNHTPGPWKRHGPNVIANGSRVAKAIYGDTDVPSLPWKENARLIAAAPDLLAALFVMVDALAPLHNARMPIERELLSDEDVDAAQVALPIALAAIQKATGHD